MSEKVQRKDKIGVRVKNKDGYYAECIDTKKGNGRPIVKFDDCDVVKELRWNKFINGEFKTPYELIVKERMQQTYINTSGYKAKIIEYNDPNKIVIQFEDGSTNIVEWPNLKRGLFKYKNERTKYNGQSYNSKYPKWVNGKNTKEYDTWIGMIERAKNEEVHKKYPSYEDCKVCDEWLNYDTFYEWIHNQENFEIWKNLPRSALDKDILIPNNKLYSPETCLLVPFYINCLFRGYANETGLPPGIVYTRSKNKKYLVLYRNVRYGTYDTLQEAVDILNIVKRSHINSVAEEAYSKGEITKQCYDAMLSYKVLING